MADQLYQYQNSSSSSTAMEVAPEEEGAGSNSGQQETEGAMGNNSSSTVAAPGAVAEIVVKQEVEEQEEDQTGGGIGAEEMERSALLDEGAFEDTGITVEGGGGEGGDDGDIGNNTFVSPKGIEWVLFGTLTAEQWIAYRRENTIHFKRHKLDNRSFFVCKRRRFVACPFEVFTVPSEEDPPGGIIVFERAHCPHTHDVVPVAVEDLSVDAQLHQLGAIPHLQQQKQPRKSKSASPQKKAAKKSVDGSGAGGSGSGGGEGGGPKKRGRKPKVKPEYLEGGINGGGGVTGGGGLAKYVMVPVVEGRHPPEEEGGEGEMDTDEPPPQSPSATALISLWSGGGGGGENVLPQRSGGQTKKKPVQAAFALLDLWEEFRADPALLQYQNELVVRKYPKTNTLVFKPLVRDAFVRRSYTLEEMQSGDRVRVVESVNGAKKEYCLVKGKPDQFMTTVKSRLEKFF